MRLKLPPLLATMFAALIILAAYCWYVKSPASIKNISTVSIGMTQSEVTSLIGEPTFKTGPLKTEVGGDSKNPAGAAVGFAMIGSENRGYWEYQIADDGNTIPSTQIENEEHLVDLAINSLFHSPDETSYVIYFRPDGRVDEVQIPNKY